MPGDPDEIRISPDHARLLTILAAVAEERERCARIVEALLSPCSVETSALLATLAAAIREGAEAE